MIDEDKRTQREVWIIDYLYGELDRPHREQFERALNSDPTLRAMYEQNLGLDALMPRGIPPYPSSQRADTITQLTVTKLMNTPWHRRVAASVRAFIGRRPGMPMQLAGVALAFGLGVLASSQFPVLQPAENEASRSKLSLLNTDQQLIDARLENYDPANEQVRFSFATLSESQVSGSLENREVRTLLAQSLTLNQSDGLRLQLVEMFGGHLAKPDVRQALITSLLNDPNPGVRYGAVVHLVKQTEHAEVRHALRVALKSDVNSGIRVEAFLALCEAIDQPFLKTLREHSVEDSNTLIRERSRRILEQHLAPETKRERTISI